ncbi:peptidoglycan hydrolase-like protein with peptidoglycan-binding domain [Mycetocola sp. BIGb0189]|uniref:glycoside hydrolase domain-containing protein n=1 Tax=Mycetocola sp. BIGb0189 TaxID=2940604 RepID=UPI0021683D4A|nr:glycoside hydrolase domain-containing protein [Mycetocola sp. BIGb0189]MCS4275484.1 peptidoglycan hydrolase-like protein with peptidoglycan-binding domain [Mycetocola sp. BIGb0189]
MFSLIRALQIELGVAGPSNTFGPGTEAAFVNSIGMINDKTSNKKIVAILQCALWCKGYTGGKVGDGWNTQVAASVAMIRSDLGLTADPVGVNAKLMKSLLTMDAYVLLRGGSDAIRAGQQTLNRRYSFRKDFYIVPCDGLFTRQMQQGLMYALQYELGMADGVATGNFGPGTIAGIKTNAQLKFGDSDGLKNFVSLFQLALSCNGYATPVSGTFDATTRSQVTSFQTFMEIDVSSKADFGTWAALLVSTGDANRSVAGMDTTDRLTKDRVLQLVNKGYTVAGRYLTVDEKNLKAGELDAILNNGMRLLPVFQNYNNAASFFTEAIGYDHGREAAIRSRQLGIRENVIIFFAVDYDATGAEASSIVLNYFRGVKKGLKVSNSVSYQVGVYGTRNVASIVHSASLATGVWVSGMSIGYSGNLGFKMPAEWMYNQIQEIHGQSNSTNPENNIDRNVVSKRARPAIRADVERVPLRQPIPGGGGSVVYRPVVDYDALPGVTYVYEPVTWTLTRALVIAENELYISQPGPNESFPNADLPMNASGLVLDWLLRQKYNNTIWNIFAPIGVDVPNVLHPRISYTPQVLDNFRSKTIPELEAANSAYGSVDDLAHMAATARGVFIFGDAANQDRLQASDLGGWGLDLVQLWVACTKRPIGVSIEAWVEANLGKVESTGFGLGDVYGDADGWLLGSQLNSNVPLDRALREIYSQYQTPTSRVAQFLYGRFGISPKYNLQRSIITIFVGIEWPMAGLTRYQFLGDAPEPTNEELTKFTLASAKRLLELGGLTW